MINSSHTGLLAFTLTSHVLPPWEDWELEVEGGSRREGEKTSGGKGGTEKEAGRTAASPHTPSAPDYSQLMLVKALQAREGGFYRLIWLGHGTQICGRIAVYMLL